MSEDRLIVGEERPEDQDVSLRPQVLSEFVGQALSLIHI